MNEKTELDPASIDWTPEIMEQIQNRAGRVLGLMPEVEPYMRAASKLGAEFDWWFGGKWRPENDPFSSQNYAFRVSPAWVPPARKVKRECGTCKHWPVSAGSMPCCLCWPSKDRPRWTPLAGVPEPEKRERVVELAPHVLRDGSVVVDT